MVPFRSLLLNSSGIIAGLFFMLLRIDQWQAIKRFGRHTGNPLSALVYIVKYFVQQGKDGVWGYVFCEMPSLLDQYVITQNVESVKHALAGGKGAIIIGAHYGPLLHAFILHRMRFNVKALLAGKFETQLHSAGTLVLRPLRSATVMFLTDPGVVLVSQKDEKHLVEHVRKGGVIITHIDYPGPAKKVGPVPFFGLPISPHVFLFRLALKYDIPVFFSLFNNIRTRGYRMDFIPSGEFSTAEEGFRSYVSYLQAQIKEYPFMWGMIPYFFERFDTGKKR
jgi:lauroyl/myristoyl acyltransferase